MRIKDVRQELHTLVDTQGVDGLLHLYQRLEKRGRVLAASENSIHLTRGEQRIRT
jgi:hypothetical protein